MQYVTYKRAIIILVSMAMCFAVLGCSASEKTGAEQAADYQSLESVSQFLNLFNGEFYKAFAYAQRGETEKAAELYQKLYDCADALDKETEVPPKAEGAHKELVGTAVCCVRTADCLVDTAEDIRLGGDGVKGFGSAGRTFDEVKECWKAYKAEIAKLEADTN